MQGWDRGEVHWLDVGFENRKQVKRQIKRKEGSELANQTARGKSVCVRRVVKKEQP